MLPACVSHALYGLAEVHPAHAALTRLSAQGAKKAFNPADVALQPLFSSVSPELLRQRRTYALFFALLDNYHRCAQPVFPG